MAIENFTNLNSRPTITNVGGLSSSSFTVAPSSTAGFPTGGQGRILIGTELCLVTDFSASPWPITRGVEGTTAAAHSQGATITPVLTSAAIGKIWNVYQDNVFVGAERGVNFHTNTNISFTVADNSANSYLDFTPVLVGINGTVPSVGTTFSYLTSTATSGLTTDLTVDASISAGWTGIFSRTRINNSATAKVAAFQAGLITTNTTNSFSEWDGLTVLSPVYNSGARSGYHVGVNVQNLGITNISYAIGTWIKDQSTANNVAADIVIGNTAPTSGSYALYSSSTYQSIFNGPVGFGVGLVNTNSNYGIEISPTLSVSYMYFDLLMIDPIISNSVSSYVIGINLSPTFSSGANTIAGFEGLHVNVPTFTSGIITYTYGVRVRNQGNSTVGTAVGAWIHDQVGANSVAANLVLGPNAPVANTSYSLYVSSTYNNVFAGPVAVGTTSAPTANSLTLADSWNLSVGTTNGTIIGTTTSQKIGFWATNPVIQPTGTTDILTGLINVGLRASGANPPLNMGTGALTTGAYTASGLVTGNAGLTITGADINLNTSSNFNFHLMDGNSSGTIAIGNTAVGQITVTPKATQSNAFIIAGNGGDWYALDTSSAVAQTTTHTFKGLGSTFASNATFPQYNTFAIVPSTVTLTGTTTVTNMTGLGLYITTPTITDASAVTVSAASTVYIQGAPSAAGSVTITTPVALDIVAGSDGGNGIRFTSNSATQTGNALLIQDSSFNVNVSVLNYIPNSPLAAQNIMFIRGQLPATMTPAIDTYILHVRAAGQGTTTAAAGQHVARFHFMSGTDAPYHSSYTGSFATSAVNAQNDTPGNAIYPISGAGGEQMNADNAIMAYSSGNGTGWNIGVIARAERATTVNIGLVGFSTNLYTQTTINVGVVGIGQNTVAGSTQVGGWFSINNAEPAFAASFGSAIVAENMASSAYIFTGLRNGTTRFLVDNNAAVSITTFGTNGGTTALSITPGTYAIVTSEINDLYVVAHTMYTSASFATQRFTRFGIPTIGSAASTITTAATVAIEDAPHVGGTGPAVITNPLALWIQAGRTSLDGQVALGRAYHKMATNNGLLSTSSGQSITLTAAILTGGILEHTVTTGAATDTLDTGTNLSAAIPGASVGDTFIFTLVNTSASAFAITLAGATGTTLKGSTATVGQNKTAMLTFLNTGTNTWDVIVNVSA